ncbi:MAG: amidohydrolase family protein [Lysobacterales bacterium]
MSRLGRWLWLLLFACLSSTASAAEYLELTDFTLIDGTDGAARTVQRMLIRDGRIVAIDPEPIPSAEPGSTWTRIDLQGTWVMPGLVDTHVHVARFPDAHAKAVTILQQALAGGVTLVRDLGGDARALAELERATGRAEIAGPDLVYSAMLGGPDIHAQGPTAQLASGRVAGEAPWARMVDANSDLRQILAEARGTGARNIKLYGDMTAPLVAAIVAESRRQQLLTTAHATVFPAAPQDLVEAGVGSLAHAAYLVWAGVDEVPADYQRRTSGPWEAIPADHPRLLALYRRMAERGVSLDATLYVYEAMQSYPGLPPMPWTRQASAWGAEATRLAHAAGVRVSTGTDWFEPRHDRELPHTHEELVLLVEKAGFTPAEAIVAGTRNGAIALGLGESHGTLELGKWADLVVLEADPLEDIRHTQQIRFTIRHGQRIEPMR